jgi:hypothetical protein
MIPKLVKIFLFIVICTAWSFAQNNSKYKSFSNGSVQIIQASDYPTIKFIEKLCSSLAKLNQEKVDCKVKKGVVIFISPADSRKEVRLEIDKDSSVVLNRARYKDVGTKILNRTLYRVLLDFSERSHIESVKCTQFSTMSYKKRSIIEFKIGNQVITLDSDSNGPKNKARLYTLRIIKTKDSFFYR